MFATACRRQLPTIHIDVAGVGSSWIAYVVSSSEAGGLAVRVLLSLAYRYYLLRTGTGREDILRCLVLDTAGDLAKA
jgi:hypothetical protein